MPVGRLAAYIRECVARDTQWAAFEPNIEPTRARVRDQVAAFMESLFREGAFAGATPEEAYCVRCDQDADRSVMIVEVEFVPSGTRLREVVAVRVQQG